MKVSEARPVREGSSRNKASLTVGLLTRNYCGVASLTTSWLLTLVTPLIERTAFSTRCFNSADRTEPTMVTFPLSTRALTSSFDRVGSAARVESIRDWIEASSTGASAGVADGDADGLVCGVGETVGDGLGDGETRGPAGMACCGERDAVSGSNVRLVMNRARKVASIAATMMLIAIHGSGLRGGPPRRTCETG